MKFINYGEKITKVAKVHRVLTTILLIILVAGTFIGGIETISCCVSDKKNAEEEYQANIAKYNENVKAYNDIVALWNEGTKYGTPAKLNYLKAINKYYAFMDNDKTINEWWEDNKPSKFDYDIESKPHITTPNYIENFKPLFHFIGGNLVLIYFIYLFSIILGGFGKIVEKNQF